MMAGFDMVYVDPLVPWPAIWGALVLTVVLVGAAVWARLSGWALRGVAMLTLIAALTNPGLRFENRSPLRDIVVIVVDDSASQTLPGRPAQSAQALEHLRAELGKMPGVELRIHRVGDSADNSGTQMMAALTQALAPEPAGRIAGAFLITDGQIHDAALAPALPAPLHLLLTGTPTDWDRRLVLQNAPAFAIVGEETRLRLQITDSGAVPPAQAGMADLSIAVNGGPAQSFRVPTGQDIDLPIRLPHAGANVLQLRTASAPGELSPRNNQAVVQINGVRDRLRVLLVSGEPHAGGRTWRNLLKADSAVDLVHFTILRPPEKQDNVPVTELSLIPFPTHELFVEKLDSFDLIIFDRYRIRGILQTLYLENIRDYVQKGGAVLVAAGPEYASVDSVFRSPLGEILPGAPTARVLAQGFIPRLSALGQRHPVTQGLAGANGGENAPQWGRWFRLVEMTAENADVVMESEDGRPLLMLDRVQQGRVALLASDQSWLWGRGYEGGGPQQELLRRLAHWLMGEPQLEENALKAEVRPEAGGSLRITRRALGPGAQQITLTGPQPNATEQGVQTDGRDLAGPERQIDLPEISPGLYSRDLTGLAEGLYTLSSQQPEGADLQAVVVIGPTAPKEFETPMASATPLADLIASTGGGIRAIADGLPNIRTLRPRRVAEGRGWLGITPRGAYETRDTVLRALLPGWLWLLIAATCAISAWMWEAGRRRRPPKT